MSRMQRCPECSEWRWPWTRCPECGASGTMTLPQYPENDSWVSGPDAYRHGS
jgi:hypothetical protein